MIPYKKYYLELKNRMLLLLFTLGFGLVVCYYYKEAVLFVLVSSSNHLSLSVSKPYFIFTNVNEIFYVYIELIFFVVNQTFILMLFYHTLMFLALGLYQFEFIRLQNAFKVFFVSWLLSTILLYKFVMPYSWSFFLSFQQTEINSLSFYFEAKIVEYLHYFMSLYYMCLINCQLLAFLTLVLTNLSEKLKQIKSFRKLFYFIFVVFSTLTTPPDVVSQVFLSGVLILTYEFLIFFQYLKLNMVTN